MPVKYIGVKSAHPTPPAAGTYHLYVLSTDGHYYLQDDTIETDLTVFGIFTDTNEPTGFIDRADSNISFVNGTLTFTIQPAVTDFSYYIAGVKYTVSSSDDVVITDTEGLHFIYYDEDTLTAVANPTSSQIETVIKEMALVAIVYWDATNDEQILLGEERHGCSMAGDTHYLIHSSFGTQYKSGAALNSLLAEQDGSLDTHAQFGVDVGEVFDEDILLSLASVGSTTGLPIYYKSGASGYWRRELNSGFSVLTTGTGRLAWNELTGGSWQKTEVTNNDFSLYHIFAANDTTYPYIAVMGEATYNNVPSARAGAETELSNLITSGMPFVEFKPIATVIFQTSNGYANSVQARIRTVGDGTDWVDWRTTGLGPVSGGSSDHNQLAGLQGGDGTNRYHLTDTEYTEATQEASGSQDGLLSQSDWTTFNSKSDYADPLTTNGDLVFRSGGSTTRLGVGTSGQVLAVSGGLPSWQDSTSSVGLLKSHLQGLQATWVLTTTARITPGSCRDDGNTIDLLLAANEDAVITSSGAGGLDTGSEASDTGYHLWLIYNPTTVDYAAMLSLSSTSPTMPSGYTKKRRVGYVYNDPSGDIAEFRTEGTGHARYVIYDRYWQVLNQGSAIAFTAVSCSPELPDTARSAWLNFFHDVDVAWVNENGASETYPIRLTGKKGAGLMFFCPVDGNQELVYKVETIDDNLDIYCWGYREFL
jgi:hypothetical protein